MLRYATISILVDIDNVLGTMLTECQLLLVFTYRYEHCWQNKHTILQFGTIVVPNIVYADLSLNILKAAQFLRMHFKSC